MIGTITASQIAALDNLVAPPRAGTIASYDVELGYVFCKRRRNLMGSKFYQNSGFFRSSQSVQISISAPRRTYFDLVYLSSSHFNFIKTTCAHVDIYLAHTFFERFPGSAVRGQRPLFDSLVLKYEFTTSFQRTISTSGSSTSFPDFTLLDHCPPGWPDSVLALFKGTNSDLKIQQDWLMFLSSPCP